MSRKGKQMRRLRHQQQETARQVQLENTQVEVSFTEKLMQFDGLPYNEKTDDPQLYIEVPHTLVRHISFKRVPV